MMAAVPYESVGIVGLVEGQKFADGAKVAGPDESGIPSCGRRMSRRREWGRVGSRPGEEVTGLVGQHLPLIACCEQCWVTLTV